jgi:hypothetical protein
MNTRQRAVLLPWLAFFFAVVGLIILRLFPIPDFDQLSTPMLKALAVLCFVVAVFTFVLGVWLVFRWITQGTVDEDEAVDLDPPDADHENDDHENGRHSRPPDFSNN